MLLVHDAARGEPLLDALSRQGEGLPARVLPLLVNEPTSLDLSLIAGAFAWGASAVRVLLPGKRAHGAEGLFRNLDIANAALAGMGLVHAAPRAAAIETDDPFSLGEALAALPRTPFAFAISRSACPAANEFASGFSLQTCLPAATACRLSRSCSCMSVRLTIRSNAAPASSASMDG